MKTVWVYVDTSKQVADKDYLKVLARAEQHMLDSQFRL
jgi:hypothetical protein